MANKTTNALLSQYGKEEVKVPKGKLVASSGGTVEKQSKSGVFITNTKKDDIQDSFKEDTKKWW